MSMLLHTQDSQTPNGPESRRGVSRAVALLLFGPMAMVIAGFGISTAGAATTSSVPNNAANVRAIIAAANATAHTSQFCTFAENVSKSNTASAATEKPASLIAAFTKLKSEEPAIIAAAPAQIKGDFQTLFNYFNKFYAELASVKYNFLKLPHSYITSLEKSAAPVEAASKAIEAYLAKTCGVKSK